MNLASLLVLALCTFSTVFAQPHFQRLHPAGSMVIEQVTNRLADVAYNNGVFVAVGDAILTSTDEGRTWSETGSRKRGFNAITFGADRFVAVGNYGEIATSTNGLRWVHTRVESSQPQFFSSVVAGGGRFVAVGAGEVATSTDGVTWAITPHWSSRAVAYGNGRFVMLERDPQWYPINGGSSSTDGVKWDDFTPTIPLWLDASCTDPMSCFKLDEVNDLTFFDGRFIALVRYIKPAPRFQQPEMFSILFSSLDGRNWTEITRTLAAMPTTVAGITPIGDRLLLHLHPFSLSGTTAYVYSWGAGLQDQVAHAAPALFRALAGTPTGLVAINQNALARPVLRTADYTDTAGLGTNWITSYAPETLLDLAKSGPVAVGVVAEGFILVSNDNLMTTRTLRPAGEKVGLRAVEFANNRFVAVGNAGAFFHSNNGEAWTKAITGITNDLYSVTFAAGLWVAVGSSGRILTSSDGLTFAPQNTGAAATLNSVAYGNNKFVAVGNGGTILTSNDGLSWTPASGSDTTDLTSITYGEGRFVAIGANGRVRASTDGSTWTSTTIRGNASSTITYGNGLFIAAGTPSASGPNEVHYSTNGVDWATVAFTDLTVRAAVFTDRELWLTGERLSIWRTAPKLAISTSATESMILHLHPDIPIPADYQLQATPSLDPIGWITLETFTNLQTATSWTDPTPPLTSRFYRLVR